MGFAFAPREVASGAITIALTRAGWFTGCTMLLVTAVSLVDVFGSRGDANHAVPALVWLAPIALGLVLLMCAPGALTGAVFLLTGSVCVYGYTASLLAADPELVQTSAYLTNRPAYVLVLVGSATGSLGSAAAWVVTGYIVGQLAMIAAFVQHGTAPMLGWVPAFVAVLYLAILGTLALIRRSQRSRLPDFAKIAAETARMARQRERERRAAAVIHDTVLGDLAALRLSPPVLSARDRERIRRDLAALDSAMQPPAAEFGSEHAHGAELERTIGDFEWRGLSVDLRGDARVLALLGADARAAVVWALRAGLDNVLAHSGTTVAEVIVDEHSGTVTAMVVDHGVGFDPDAVAPDRLGLRASILNRMEQVGGSARVWSSPGQGTCLMLTVPVPGDHTGAVPSEDARETARPKAGAVPGEDGDGPS